VLLFIKFSFIFLAASFLLACVQLKYADPDPDPGFHLNADPDPESGFRILDPKNRKNLKFYETFKFIFFSFLAFLSYLNR